MLFQWLSLRLTEEEIQYAGKLWSIPENSLALRCKFREELMAIHTWMLADMLQTMFPDEEEFHAMLGAVLSQIYEHLANATDVDYGTWGLSLTAKWNGYSAAMPSTHQQGPLWVLAKHIDSNLFGERRFDFQAQHAMVTYIGVTMKHLGKTLAKYGIRE